MRFIHNWVITGIQWMVSWWVLVHYSPTLWELHHWQVHSFFTLDKLLTLSLLLMQRNGKFKTHTCRVKHVNHRNHLVTKRWCSADLSQSMVAQVWVIILNSSYDWMPSLKKNCLVFIATSKRNVINCVVKVQGGRVGRG